MKLPGIFTFLILAGLSTSTSAHAESDPYFLACTGSNNMQLTMSFDAAGRMFTYVLTEDGMPRGFYATPGAGYGFSKSYVTSSWRAEGEFEFKAQIMGGNQLSPKFLYSADVKLKDLGAGSMKLESIEVLYHGQSQRLIWFVGAACKVHQGYP